MAEAMIVRNRRAQRIFRRRKTLEEAESLADYRLPRETIRALTDEYSRSEFSCYTARSHAIPAESEMLAALRYFGKGGMLSEAASIHGISKSSMSRVIGRVSSFICSKAPEMIQMPRRRQELNQTARDFHVKADFPGVVGAVDGTHIGILSPSHEEWAYVNRKSYHSINVQVLLQQHQYLAIELPFVNVTLADYWYSYLKFCVQVVSDATLKLRNVVARLPGSTHDAFIFNNSQLKTDLDHEDLYNGYWLLGDSGYPCKRNLLTPLAAPVTQAERRYNAAHKKTRVTVERCIGVWKSRFRCLHKTGGLMQLMPEMCCKVIMACAVLHNICIDGLVAAGDVASNDDDDNDDIDSDDEENDDYDHMCLNGTDGTALRE